MNILINRWKSKRGQTQWEKNGRKIVYWVVMGLNCFLKLFLNYFSQ
jgi:hypothetical protein